MTSNIHFNVLPCMAAETALSLSAGVTGWLWQRPSRLAIDWQSVDWRVSGTWGFSFPSPPLFHQLTDKVEVSSRLSLPAPDSLSSGKHTPDDPPVPGTHHRQLILHHHFLIRSPRADFSGCDQPPRCPRPVSPPLPATFQKGERTPR